MLPYIIDEFEGEFWIEYEEGVCRVKASVKIPELTASKKEDLIEVAKNKQNAAAVGVVGKIRNAIETLFLGEDALLTSFYTSASAFRLATGYSEGVDYSYLWSLEQYRSTVEREGDAWDELEKSVIAAVADDVIVGVKGKRADIIIVKKFA